MKLIQWHRERVENLAYRSGLSMYQMSWLSFLKGLVFGFLIGKYL